MLTPQDIFQFIAYVTIAAALVDLIILLVIIWTVVSIFSRRGKRLRNNLIATPLALLAAFLWAYIASSDDRARQRKMQAKADVNGSKDLYEFWGDKLYKEVRDESGIIINLASKEYYKCIDKYLTDEDRFITCDFVEEVKGKLVTKGTYAKMARGEMVRFMAEKRIENPLDIKKFDRLSYIFREDLSNNVKFVFERKKQLC